MKRTILCCLVVIAALLVGCAKPHLEDVTLEQFHQALAGSDILVIDVRDTMDMSGDTIDQIKGSLAMPLSALPANLQKIPKDKMLYVLSNDAKTVDKAAKLLADAKYPHIYRVRGTLTEYKAKFGKEAEKYIK